MRSAVPFQPAGALARWKEGLTLPGRAVTVYGQTSDVVGLGWNWFLAGWRGDPS